MRNCRSTSLRFGRDDKVRAVKLFEQVLLLKRRDTNLVITSKPLQPSKLLSFHHKAVGVPQVRKCVPGSSKPGEAPPCPWPVLQPSFTQIRCGHSCMQELKAHEFLTQNGPTKETAEKFGLRERCTPSPSKAAPVCSTYVRPK